MTQESADQTTGSSTEDGLPKNRAAFLFGFYLQIHAVDSVIAPMMAVCSGLPVVKILLIDSCLSRIGALDTDITFRKLPGARFELEMEIIKLRAISRSLWSGRSELRSWYLAGVAVGLLVVRLEESMAQRTLTAADFAEATDFACAEFRKAAKWRPSQSIESESCQRILQLSGEWLQYLTSEGKKVDSVWLCRWVEEFANILTDNYESSSVESSGNEERAQFIYEGFAIHGLFGKELLTRVNKTGETRGWMRIENPDKLREIANKYAADHQLSPVPERARGRMRDAEKP